MPKACNDAQKKQQFLTSCFSFFVFVPVSKLGSGNGNDVRERVCFRFESCLNTSTSTSTFQLSRQVSKRLCHTNKTVNRSERMKFVDPIESESIRERTPSQGILNRCLLVELFLLEFFSFLGYYVASGVIPYCNVKFRKKAPPNISPPNS